MSAYYKYDFVSPEPLFAQIQLELSSYFDTGAVSASLFPTWVNQALIPLGRGTYPIKNAVLSVCDYSERLPDDFKYVREAWSCEVITTDPIRNPSSIYQQLTPSTKAIITSRVDASNIYCDVCTQCRFPDTMNVVYKTTDQILFQIRRTHLLTPANIQSGCPQDLFCANYYSTGYDNYDISDGKFVTTCREAVVHLLYYSESYDDYSNQLIPDDEEGYFQKYIRAYLKARIFEQLWNQNTDETYNQSYQKYQIYQHEADEAFILARIEAKKDDMNKKIRRYNKRKSRNWKYEL